MVTGDPTLSSWESSKLQRPAFNELRCCIQPTGHGVSVLVRPHKYHRIGCSATRLLVTLQETQHPKDTERSAKAGGQAETVHDFHSPPSTVSACRFAPAFRPSQSPGFLPVPWSKHTEAILIGMAWHAASVLELFVDLLQVPWIPEALALAESTLLFS